MNALPAPALALAVDQFGVIARFQLRRWLTADQIDGLAWRGHLEKLQRGVYRVRGGAVVGQQAPFAAALRARPRATVTGPAVLGHLDVDGFAPDAPFEILVAPGRRLSHVRFGWRHDPRPDRDVLRCGEVRLTTPADALVHSVAWRERLGDRSLRLACDWLGWRGLLDRDAFLTQLVARAEVDHLAAGMLEVVGGIALGRSESDGERALGRIVQRFDPAPEAQVWVTPRRRTDWYFRWLRLGLEYDGLLDHGGRTGSEADVARDAEVEAAGARLLHVRPAELADERALLTRIVTALTARAHELGVRAPVYDPSPERGAGARNRRM